MVLLALKVLKVIKVHKAFKVIQAHKAIKVLWVLKEPDLKARKVDKGLVDQQDLKVHKVFKAHKDL